VRVQGERFGDLVAAISQLREDSRRARDKSSSKDHASAVS
jgi:hypothetical protein